MKQSNFTQKIEGFLEAVKTVWNQGVFGIDIGSILVVAGIIVFFILFRKIIFKFIINRINNFAQKT